MEGPEEEGGPHTSPSPRLPPSSRSGHKSSLQETPQAEQEEGSGCSQDWEKLLLRRRPEPIGRGLGLGQQEKALCTKSLALQVDARIPRKASFVVPKASQHMDTVTWQLCIGGLWAGRVPPLLQGSGTELHSALFPRQQLVHRKDLWEGSWKPRVLTLVP